MSALPPIRPDLSLTEGYHSPQVEAEVRLNTNESPFPPPEGWSRDLLAALSEVSFHRYPDRPATELRVAVAALHDVTPEEVFCANGSKPGAPVPAAGLRRRPAARLAVFEPTYALHSHISRPDRHRRSSRADATDDFAHRPRRGRRGALVEHASPTSRSCCSPNNPTGPRRAARDRRRRLAGAAPGAGHRRRGVRPVRTSGAPSPCGGRGTRAWS